ncbi:cytidylyltransferase [Colletotrichum paranaense]|uniref:dolichol kinase n=2 Tax=Colletotrichum acutatum species complex TaxID=2707335 RepID=A0AAI9XL76_9PEZI|nr:cytidylyltransferase [Colletotrichum paranaense]KAK1453677.1 cytidylyltransferase [Colletotrichum melonis]KAK1538135.1 cytidylyltransferase [Colletotrichum paranaense]
MPAHLEPNALFGHDTEANHEIRSLSRSPHPYHHLNTELPHPAHRLVYKPPNAAPTPPRTSSTDSSRTPSPFPSFAKDSSQGSDSGTEADDEHFLKGLPAPKVRLHKGLRGQNEVLSGSSTPLFSPDQEEDALRKQKEKEDRKEARRFLNDRNYRRTKELIRRVSEFIIVGSLFAVVRSNPLVKPLFTAWIRELRFPATLITSLMILYPVRLFAWSTRHRASSKKPAIAVPTVFDPAPILYPPSVTLLVALLISPDNQAVILTNIILSISSIPKYLIPTARAHEAINPLQWVLSCVPMWLSQQHPEATLSRPSISPETAVLLYPLHQTLLEVLHYLTTTSLLTAELQLLSIALINVLLLAHSPQATILQALLWGGGVGVLVVCGPVIRWGIALARVPRLRFRRVGILSKKSSVFGFLSEGLSMRRFKHELLGSSLEESASELGDSEEEIINGPFAKPMRVRTFGMADMPPRGERKMSASPDGKAPASPNGFAAERRNTFPYALQRPRRSLTHTSAGRRKRTASTTVRSFFKLTEAQATMRKWSYATYVYTCIVLIILVPVREYIGRHALLGNEPVGWALGYLFGELPWFRFKVVEANLERWICLPARLSEDVAKASCHQGWVQHIRLADFGEANTRLLMAAYWLAIVIVGLTVVIRLDPKYEVDTRRKVFHFMMVGMFLPATFIDPVFAALALSLVLAIFLILDLLRASQLPPLSRPIASFLTPYVDGRDHKGPVVISHLFLLIGCAIPLWLSLATLPRSGSGYLTGWEVPTREVSMVAGVICVGLGDAAASLIGRRYGHRKWVWGGGKSLEGSVAFAVAVFLGLMAATTWLRVGRWPVAAEQHVAWPTSARNAGFCASMASLTEAVLTGGNDNVIVPVVLWTCVKSIGV